MVSFVFASSSTEQIKQEFLDATNSMLKVVQDKSIKKEIRDEKIIKIISPIFDFELMAKLSLGKVWKSMTKTQRDNFVAKYVTRMKKSYSDKIDKYTDQKIVINSIKQTKKTRAILDTSLIGADEKYNVVYKYYKARKKQNNKKYWLIYDVLIEGVSIIKADRAQFKAILQTSTIEDLTNKL
jgi:phospholipid transport system substrate-binding protein